jgi:hypothetical protein
MEKGTKYEQDLAKNILLIQFFWKKIESLLKDEESLLIHKLAHVSAQYSIGLG